MFSMGNLEHTFYFDGNGKSEQRLRYLNCYERVVYFYYKNKYLLEYDIFNLFICNYLPVIEISNNGIVNLLGYPLFKTDQSNVQLSYISGKLSDLIDLVGKGEYAVFQTSDPDVPFSNVYNKFDLDESEYGEYYLAIASNDDYLYLPLYLHNGYDRLYNYNENIFYIHWDNMKDAFDKQLKVYRFVRSELTRKTVDEIHYELFCNISQYYNYSKKESSDLLTCYGIKCIEALLNYCTIESLNLDDKIGDKPLYKVLKTCILSTISKRKILKDCLEKTYPLRYESLIQKINGTINAYITLISILEIEYMKNNRVFGNRYKKSLEGIIFNENEMSKTLSDYIKNTDYKSQ